MNRVNPIQIDRFKTDTLDISFEEEKTSSIARKAIKQVSAFFTKTFKLPFAIQSISEQHRVILSEIEDNLRPFQEEPKTLYEKVNLTNLNTSAFTKKTYLCSLVHGIYYFVEKKSADFSKVRKVINDIESTNKINIKTVSSSIKKHFPKLSYLNIIKYYFLLSFVVNLQGWLDSFTNDILQYLRETLKNGQKLPDAGKKLLESMNIYIALYNKKINQFRDDKSSLPGDRDTCIKQLFDQEKYLEGKSEIELQKLFSKNIIEQFIDVKFFRRPFLKNNKSSKKCNFIVEFLDRKLNKFIKLILRKYLLDNLIPPMVNNSIDAIDSAAFEEAMHQTLSDLMKDILLDLEKPIKERLDSDLDRPDIVGDQLKGIFKKLTNSLFITLRREKYKTQEELNNIKERSFFEKKVDKSIEEALKEGLAKSYNLLCQPENNEKYLAKLMGLLTKIYDLPPKADSIEDRKLKRHQINLKKRFLDYKELLIKKFVEQAVDDEVNIFFGYLAKGQKESLEFFYRKIRYQVNQDKEMPATALSNQAKILNNSIKLELNDQRLKDSKKELNLMLKNMQSFIEKLDNIKPKGNGPLQKELDKHYGPLVSIESSISKILQKIQNYLLKIEALFEIEKNLKQIKLSIDDIQKHNFLKQKEIIISFIEQFKKINVNENINKILQSLYYLKEHIEEILEHEKTVKILNSIILIKDNKSLLNNLIEAQLNALTYPTHRKTQKKLIECKNEIEKKINDISNIKDKKDLENLIKIILNSKTPLQIAEAKEQFENSIKNKIVNHKNLTNNKKNNLSISYDVLLRVLKNQLNFIPRTIDAYHQKNKDLSDKLENHLEKLINLMLNIENNHKIKRQIKLNDFSSLSNVIRATTNIFSVWLSSSYIASYLPILAPKVALGVGMGASFVASEIALNRSVSYVTKKSITKYVNKIASEYTQSAYNILMNQTFYRGLTHSLMLEVIKTLKN
ncbi:MAG: hypothetical protein K1060chlam5_00237 [Candidatus Anoxychlamydiales bacterium]|nr:hypothetical protein [Candidatus Anoxychlamydiales bacterium]